MSTRSGAGPSDLAGPFGLAGLFDLTGRVALVTGGGRGIGRMITEGLLAAGASVIISSRKAQACTEAVAELEAGLEAGDRRRVWAVPADLSTEEECLRLAREVGGLTDQVHILVNNAGATWGASFEEYPAAAWDKVVDLDLKSPFYLTRALLPLLEKAARPDDPARVINIGSIDGLHTPSVPNFAYGAAKAGLHHLTRILAKELGPRGVTVNAVAPGPFATKMMAATLAAQGDRIAAASPLGRIGTPQDMAGVSVFLASRAGAYVTGAVIPVDGGIATTL